MAAWYTRSVDAEEQIIKTDAGPRSSSSPVDEEEARSLLALPAQDQKERVRRNVLGAALLQSEEHIRAMVSRDKNRIKEACRVIIPLAVLIDKAGVSVDAQRPEDLLTHLFGSKGRDGRAVGERMRGILLAGAQQDEAAAQRAKRGEYRADNQAAEGLPNPPEGMLGGHPQDGKVVLDVPPVLESTIPLSGE